MRNLALPRADNARGIVSWFARVTNRRARNCMVGTRHARTIGRCRRVALAIVPLLAASSALAQAGRVAEIATYQGPDREQRLIEGAKKEKELTFYSSMPSEDIALLVGAFDRKYGVKVKVWRA